MRRLAPLLAVIAFAGAVACGAGYRAGYRDGWDAVRCAPTDVPDQKEVRAPSEHLDHDRADAPARV